MMGIDTVIFSAMQEFTTPMMKQYQKIKEQYLDCLLFYRMGDFYELFCDDALLGAKILNITLTSRPKGKDGRIPMAGVPYHAVDTYLSKLVKAGYKVAICEQLSPPNKNGIIHREVIRIVTPGTMLDEKALEKKENNIIISIFIDGKTFSLTAADISTGFFAGVEKQFDDLSQILKDELIKLHPVECILPENLYNDFELLKILKTEKELNVYPFLEWDTFSDKAKEFLKSHFKLSTLAGFGIEEKSCLLKSSAALLGYLQQTQKSTVSHIKKITVMEDEEFVVLDKSTVLNLELFSTIREHDTRGTFLNTLDQTITAMGGRLLKSWICKPLTNSESINARLDAVEEIISQNELKTNLRENLKGISDIERLLSRLSVGLGNARDLLNLKSTLQIIPEVKEKLSLTHSAILQEIKNNLSPSVEAVIKIIDANIADEPPIDLKIGGLIKPGVNKKLDDLRYIVSNSKQWIAQLEQTERERTGISSLKVRYNKVFGFYIEISKSNLSNVPKDYLRKQTLVNGERFITPELKKQEEIILSAEETIFDLEYKLFCEVLEKILEHVSQLQDTASAIAVLDCLLNFAHISEINTYTRPKIIHSGEIKIKNSRHPVVEKLLEDKQFVPNNIEFSNSDASLHIITGPNMAGKSVFIRQIALLVLMAQLGCFIPASYAEISVVDRIFVRSGASDVITSGLSTFMVEMVETAHILNTSSKNSLIIMDEIGRGTSTYDGISIAWAIAQYLVTHFSKVPKTLFATHYHELQKLEEVFPSKIKNYSMAVTEENGEPVFLYKVVEGGASSSFGVAVAKLAGVPEQVINIAGEKLKTLENPINEKTPSTISFDTSDLPILEHVIAKELENLDISNMTPLEALNKLAEIKSKLKIIQQDNEKFLEIN